MGLLSVGSPAWKSIRGVRLGMLDGLTFVPVLVTHDALDNIERTPREAASISRALPGIGVLSNRSPAPSTSAESPRKMVVIVRAHLKTASR